MIGFSVCMHIIDIYLRVINENGGHLNIPSLNVAILVREIITNEDTEY